MMQIYSSVVMNGVFAVLKCANVSYDVRNHAKFREVYQVAFHKIGRALFDEHQIHQVHAQVWYTWRVTFVLLFKLNFYFQQKQLL